jgi:hypothetical protein
MDANNNSNVSGKLVHIGAEVLVLVSVVFYLNGQLKSMKNEIRELRAKLEDQTEGTHKHLTKLYAMVDNLQSRPPFPAHLLNPGAFSMPPGPFEGGHHNHFVSRQAPAQMGLRKRRPGEENSNTKPSNAKVSSSHTNSRKPVNNPKREVKIVEEVEDPELPDEDTLDEELKDELAEMEALESLEENEDDAENEKNENVKLSKALEQPAQDLSFVQSAIRPTARKSQPIVKKTL